MHCAKCGTDNRPAAKFCDKCGARLAPTCPSCGAENRPDARFCDSCGTTFGAPAVKKSTDAPLRVPDTSAPENIDGERKTVTALFADIKGSMDLMEDLDPEEARSLVDPALKLMIDAVHRYDGYIVQSTGDGIFALFGAPVAHEDHPQRALYAALRMQEEMRRYSAKLREAGNPPVEARVGINTGETVVRSIQTGDAHTEYTPIGHSTSLASRMQALAPTGSIAVTETTQKLCAGYFNFKALGPTRVRGVTGPVNVFEVTGLGPLRTRLQRSAGRGLTRFVGRQREIEAMKHAAERARAGHGQIVAAMAEAGVGKSRLFFEFKAMTQANWMVLETFSVSHGKASAYLPLIELLTNYFGIRSEDDERRRREKVAGRLAILDPALEDTRPYIFALLGIAERLDPRQQWEQNLDRLDEYLRTLQEKDSLAQMDPHIQRRRTLDAIKRILLRESLNQPVMVIFEDLHWIDEATQECLNLLADSIATARLLLLVNYRPEYVHQWNSKTYYSQLRLDPLGKESADEMLSALLGDDAGLTQLKRVIIDRTEGNPFFMEETVQVLLDDGSLHRNGVIKLTRPISELKIPPTVQAILASRIDRLPAEAKDLLQRLAVIGREFPLSLIRAVVGKSDDELNRLLNDLQLGEFIYEQPAMGDSEYTFKHALTQEVAYGSVLMERRRGLHAQIGAAIEVAYAGSLDDHLPELAHHYSRGGNPEKAVEYLTRFGDQAMQRSAYAEAKDLFGRALEMIGALAPSADRNRKESLTRLNLGICAITSDVAAMTNPETVESLERAHALCEELGNDAHHCDVLAALAYLHANRFEPEKAQHACEELLAIATELNDVDMIGRAHFLPGFSAFSGGDFVAALKALDRAYQLPRVSRSRQEFSVLGWQPLTRSMGAIALTIMGYPERGRARYEEALALVEEDKDRSRMISMLVWSAILNIETGYADRALGAAEEGLRLIREENAPLLLVGHQFWRAVSLIQLGKIGEGISALIRLEEPITRLATNPLGAVFYPYFVGAHLAAGMRSEGLKAVARGLEIVETNRTRFPEAELRRLHGELLLLRKPDADEAERCLREAIAINRRQQAKWWELRATRRLARLLRDSDRREEGRAMLAELYGWFTEGFETADLRDARVLLDELQR